ncbi:MAG: hypothetical protein A2Z91_03660 [Deltaproteobacteria bacterium GWA2_38_16]|nr:MAG: hypothetical protein A2Z91_03660 [Deltaproteobacteria bacterium GWA2_38_16]OGQ02324.1 MAG: hypothetical protein A3D19_05835 [Deltaproteobacteria bacterium RIFCSPHIGHO2_02_FULL_38_15]OGQ30431.1 MAG: hypothetical protein A3A72_02510 [Deltaproteobacteria bacterium RIFCSPLOWO2_01_FULL_38_9]OGQ62003.1 MAG: hypothetical protein A3G92_07375 [Deltaproteobacteria bacterium RIFCSPLOWO2_12_FULL_38_8]HBQ22092.1 hypothetical protein [Deltaproteobacteria bacterium]
MTPNENINNLVLEFKEGNEKAFNELFLQFQKPIYGLAMRILANHSDADEVVQKTFMQVYLNLNTFRGESSFKTWLYKIAINQCKDHLKNKEQQISKIDLETPAMKKLKVQSSHPLKKIIGEQHTQILLEKINALSQQQKTAIILRVFDDLAFKEIAEALDCTESTAKVHYHQAILKLKGMFKDHTRGELR